MKWENELYNHEVNPPEKVWDGIVHDLDNEFIAFKQALYNASVQPPAHQWDAIRHRLHSNAGSPPKIIANVLRIVAAAAFIGVSFFAVNYLMTERAGNITIVTDETPAPAKIFQKQEKATPTAPGANKRITFPVTNPSMASMISLPKKRKTNINTAIINDNNSDKHFSHATVHILSVSSDYPAITDRYAPDQAATKRIRDLKGRIREDVQLQDLHSSYFFTTGANGQAVRVSSKFRNIIQYLNSSDGEQWMETMMKEKQNWENLFKQWKTEVGHSIVLPSAGNFMDIAEMMQLLQTHYNK
ncbi:MAG TPA: hypothetical protein VFV68_04085 [Agriterribacter sp.]|nr:hypothetical protein [Agriterribacter sp.]